MNHCFLFLSAQIDTATFELIFILAPFVLLLVFLLAILARCYTQRSQLKRLPEIR